MTQKPRRQLIAQDKNYMSIAPGLRVGYACILLGEAAARLQTINLARLNDTAMERVVQNNLNALEAMLRFNAAHGIHLFRVSSDLIPLATHPKQTFPWRTHFAEKLAQLGELARRGGIRLSVHPGQYTVLSSPDSLVCRRSIEDLIYHGQLLESMGCDMTSRIILHLGGGYGDKVAATNRFIAALADLPDFVRRRITLENDERIYNISQVLDVAAKTGLPAVFDNLHHQLNPPAEKQKNGEVSWIKEAMSAWPADAGIPKIHYSQQATGKKRGAHSVTIRIGEFLDWLEKNSLQDKKVNVMLEVKDKNISAVKCQQCLAEPDQSGLLEWLEAAELLSLSRGGTQAIELARTAKANDPRGFWEIIETFFEIPSENKGLQQVLALVKEKYKEVLTPRHINRINVISEELASENSLSGSEHRLTALLRRLALDQNIDDLNRQLYVIYSSLL